MPRDVDVIEAIVDGWIQGIPAGVELKDDRATLILALLGEFNRLESETRAKVAEEIAVAIEARAQRIRDEAWEPSAGMAMAVLVEEDARIAREHGKES